MEKALQEFLVKKGLFLKEILGKGHSSRIFLAEDKKAFCPKPFSKRLAKNASQAKRLCEANFPRLFSAEKRLVIKMERADSTRFRMAEREAENLALANSLGIGPRLFGKDLKCRIILMEFIEGPSFAEWLFAGPSKKGLARFVKELQRQAMALDKIGLDHGQLAGRGRNILVRKGLPVIIDFEKASTQRKCHNASAIEAFLFRNPHGAVAKKARAILTGL